MRSSCLSGRVVLAWMVGGWLLARAAFRLEPRGSDLPSGSAWGWAAFVFASNVLAHWLASRHRVRPGAGRPGAPRRRPAGLEASPCSLREDLVGWPVLAGILAATILFTLIGRGLAILDDRKKFADPHSDDGGRGHSAALLYEPGRPVSLSLRIPTARGERRPPRGPVPWSAFDLTKGFAAALSLGAAYLVGWRLGHRSAAGWVTAACLLFGGGARWFPAVAAADFPGRGQRPRRALGIGRFVRRQPAPGDARAVDHRRGTADADSLRLPEWDPRAFRPRDAGRAGLPLTALPVYGAPRSPSFEEGIAGVASLTILFSVWALGFDASSGCSPSASSCGW